MAVTPAHARIRQGGETGSRDEGKKFDVKPERFASAIGSGDCWESRCKRRVVSRSARVSPWAFKTDTRTGGLRWLRQ